jgi:hypothetical protein
MTISKNPWASPVYISGGSHEWTAIDEANRMCCGATREEAMAEFTHHYGHEKEWRFVAGARPRPPRPGFRGDEAEAEKPTPEPATQLNDRGPLIAATFARLAKRFHPDHAGDALFSGSIVMQALIELRDAMKPDA